MKYGLPVPKVHLPLLVKALGHKNITEFNYNGHNTRHSEILFVHEADRTEAKRLLNIITPIN